MIRSAPAILLLSIVLAPANGVCASIAPVAASSITVAAIKTQNLTVARSVNVTSGTAVVDAWMVAGSTALQTDNSDAHITDTPCPVKLTRSGSIATFSAAYDVISSNAMFVALSTTVAQQVKIVSRITVCGSTPLPAGAVTFNGCADTTQLVLAADAPLTPESLTHEYGHYKGLGHRTVKGFERWIMWWQGLANRNVVDSTECAAYVR